MENGQEETKTEKVTEEKPSEVKDAKLADEAEPQKEETNSESKPEEKEDASDAKVQSQDDEPEPTEELLKKIKEQVEFYFGNINMQRDKFLIEQTKLDAGWIPMDIMLKFKTLASLSKNNSTIIKALEKSELIEVSEDKRKIRRSPNDPLPVYNEEYRKGQEGRTVYIKGFPLQETTIEKLKEFFGNYEPFEYIVMRKYLDKAKKLQFKGSIFLQFKTLDDAKAFMSRESVKYGENELIRKWSAEYSEEKSKEKEERRQKRTEKGKKNEDGKEGDAEGEDESSEKDSGLPKGSVIHFTGVSDQVKREDIRECLVEFEAPIVFIDFKKGDTEGWIRLQGENAAKPIVDKMKESKITVLESEVTCRVLEGEEETKYLAKAKEEIANNRQKLARSKRGGRRREVIAAEKGPTTTHEVMFLRRKWPQNK